MPELAVLAGIAVGLLLLYQLTLPAPRGNRRRSWGIALLGLGAYAMHFGAIEAYTTLTRDFDDLQLTAFWAATSIPLTLAGVVLLRRR